MSALPEPAPVPPVTISAPAAPSRPAATPIPSPIRKARALRRLLAVSAAAAVLGLVAVLVLAAAGGAYRRARLTAPENEREGKPAARLARANKAIGAALPRGTYVVVDSFANRLRVYRDGELQRSAVVSTGSRTALRDPNTGRIWVFQTPLGEQRVRNKVRDPVWIKPDWAFVEEGVPIPKNRRERYDDVSLGDYALYLGDGYLIHGTIFQTLLGTPVTHGCIRLGDADLEYVYRNVPVGSRVYIH